MANNQVAWLNYLFFADFSSDESTIAAIPVGALSQADATQLAALLSTHDSGEGRALWVDQANPDWGLLGATVTYNGPNLTGFATNGAFNSVLMLSFPDTQNSPQGLIALNYNSGEGVAPALVVATPEPSPAPTDDTPAPADDDASPAPADTPADASDTPASS
jgi:hypothetical protein